MPKPPLQFYNTLSRKKERFKPFNSKDLKMYVCGPTVYDRIHIGNARPLVVFDVVARLLRYRYPSSKITYVRNITDVDDKINKRAEEYGIPIDELTAITIKRFQADCAALGLKKPTEEPRATEHIPEMIAMIKILIEKGHAYEEKNHEHKKEWHVLFNAAEFPNYGNFLGRSVDEMKAGARVKVAPYKESHKDFVLWKPSDANTPGWDSPWGRGRPGWHIECSAMSRKHLGTEFDIHGGGVDLVFPHHENEFCQSYAANGKHMARYWLHNGYVMMGGEKMAKSEGNFVDMGTLLGERKGEVIRLALLQTHYRKPLEFSHELLDEAETILDRFYRAVGDIKVTQKGEVDAEFVSALADDLNTPAALERLHKLVRPRNDAEAKILKRSAKLLGLLQNTESQWFRPKGADDDTITALILEREFARQNQNYVDSDGIRFKLEEEMNIILEDTPQGTKWRRK